MDLAIAILSAFGSSAAFGGIFWKLLDMGLKGRVEREKLVLQNQFDKDRVALEQLYKEYQMTLDQKYKQDMVEFQHKFDLATLTIQIRSGGIFQHRAEFLFDFYKAINEVHKMSMQLTDCISFDELMDGDVLEEQAPIMASKELSRAVDRAKEIYDDGRLLLSESLDKLTSEIFSELYSCLLGFEVIYRRKGDPKPHYSTEYEKRRNTVYMCSHQIIDSILPEFRNLIGTSGTFDNS